MLYYSILFIYMSFEGEDFTHPCTYMLMRKTIQCNSFEDKFMFQLK